tara:strand:- start:607 stop:774 length:168 start_codon:yes stop_codon:yes gene_type:complete
MPTIKKDGTRYGKPIFVGVTVPQIVADVAVKMIQDGKMTQKEAISILKKNFKKKK